jgi:2-keto-4-pentenoate hydratase/2-oxohepta-3-ene-1,7-dioic acid hydratase in catechol pathway
MRRNHSQLAKRRHFGGIFDPDGKIEAQGEGLIMKIARFIPLAEPESPARRGILEDGWLRELSGGLFDPPAFTGRRFGLADVRLLAPVMPRHIIGIGKNFTAPGEPKPPEPDMPILFFKPLGTVIGPGDPIMLPDGANRVKFESEVAVVIGRTARRIRPEDADGVIFGCTVANDVSALDFFHPEGHWTIGKAFDSFCPLGPVIDTAFDWRTARIRASVNGVPKQDGAMDEIIMPVDRQIAYISRFMTLQPGDVILTGTPAGADWVGDGDVVTCAVDGIGELTNPVAAPA